ncbi:MAG TPA: Rid family hydrolase [Albitalea sp.]|nr:Rid family hydrolase [Albitalea sp.]
MIQTFLQVVVRGLGLVGLVALGACASTPASVTFHPIPNAAKPAYSEAVEVKSAGISTLYVSSLVPEPADPSQPKESRAYFGDTQVQTDGLLKRMKALLERRGFTMRDVVKVNVYVVADPAKGNLPDGEGFAAAYARHFGTAEVPNLPARTRFGVVPFPNPAWLVALDVVAVKAAP